MTDDAKELKSRYDQFAQTLDYRTTASDFQLRELEIDTVSECMGDGMTLLDAGCGLGYAAVQYATRFRADVRAIDYSEKMIAGARELLASGRPPLRGTVTFDHASVLELPFETASFDVVTSSRCLMALLDWELQRRALIEIHRVLKPGGVLVLMEGTLEGLESLNTMRARFALEPIAPDGRDRLITLKFKEEELKRFCRPYYELERTKRFGMYYFLTRVVQPLLVAPENPIYSHKLNQVAREIARLIPDFEGLGHLVAFVMIRRR